MMVWTADQFWKMVDTFKKDIVRMADPEVNTDHAAKIAESAVLLAILREAYPAGST